jgi:hypothetical protein
MNYMNLQILAISLLYGKRSDDIGIGHAASKLLFTRLICDLLTSLYLAFVISQDDGIGTSRQKLNS